MAEIRSGKLITQMAVTGTGTETSQTCNQCTNDWWIYLGSQIVKKFICNTWRLWMFQPFNDNKFGIVIVH